MFGSVAFMVQGNMACGVIGDDLIVRIPPKRYEDTLTKPHVRTMDITRRGMHGWVVGGPEDTPTEGTAKVKEHIGNGTLGFAISTHI